MHRRLAVLLLVAWSLACGEAATTTPGAAHAGPGEGALFIGNSLTMSNDLPGVVSALAAAAGGRLPTTVVAFPGFALEDHWAGASPVGLPASVHTASGTSVAISPPTARLLQEAAAAANAQF